MKKIFLLFLLIMAGILYMPAQVLDANVEQRLKDFFTNLRRLMLISANVDLIAMK